MAVWSPKAGGRTSKVPFGVLVVPRDYLLRGLSYRFRVGTKWRSVAGVRMTGTYSGVLVPYGLDRLVFIYLATEACKQGRVVTGSVEDIAKVLGLATSRRGRRRVEKIVRARLERVVYSAFEQDSHNRSCECGCRDAVPERIAVARGMDYCQRTGEFKVVLTDEFLDEAHNGVLISSETFAAIRSKSALTDLYVWLVQLARSGSSRCDVWGTSDRALTRVLQVAKKRFKTRQDLATRLALLRALWPSLPYHFLRADDVIESSVRPGDALQEHLGCAPWLRRDEPPARAERRTGLKKHPAATDAIRSHKVRADKSSQAGADRASLPLDQTPTALDRESPRCENQRMTAEKPGFASNVFDHRTVPTIRSRQPEATVPALPAAEVGSDRGRGGQSPFGDPEAIRRGLAALSSHSKTGELLQLLGVSSLDQSLPRIGATIAESFAALFTSQRTRAGPAPNGKATESGGALHNLRFRVRTKATEPQVDARDGPSAETTRARGDPAPAAASDQDET